MSSYLPETVTQWARLAKRFNMKRIRAGDLELEFFEHKLEPVGETTQIPTLPLNEMPTDEELLFMSADSAAIENPSSHGKEPHDDAGA